MNNTNNNHGHEIDQLHNRYIQLRIRQSELPRSHNFAVHYVGKMIRFDEKDIVISPYVRYKGNPANEQKAIAKLERINDSIGNSAEPQTPKGIAKLIIAEWSELIMLSQEEKEQ